jgi:peptide/nickel transport system substrate-binding protein
VLFTIQTIQNTNARSPLSKDWQGITVERVSQLQIRFTLPAPYVFFTENLKRTRIIPQHIFGAIPVENVRLSGYNLEPVGSGPYKFSQYSKRKDGFITEYILIPNELFSGHAPYITQFSFKFYPTQDELLKDFRLRRVNGFGSALPLGTEIQNLPRVTKEEVPMPRYYSIFLNAINNPALKDDNLRFALSLAIDKKKIINDVFKGSASTIESPLFSSLITFESQDALGTSTTPVWPTTSSTSSYDPVEAARIISQLKTKDIKLSLVVPDVPFLTKAADIIKENWLASGIGEVTIYKENADTITEEYVKTRNYELLLFGNIFENPADLFPFWHSSQRFYPGLNLSLYQHLEADRIMEMVRQKNEVEAQTQGLLTLDAIIREDNPALFLFSLPYFYAHEARLSGFAPAFITAPEDRFQNVEAWSVAQARILQ